MRKIMVKPFEITDYFLENYEFLQDNLILIAENGMDGVEVFLTSENDKPFFQVEVDEAIVYQRGTINGVDAEKSLAEIHALYLGGIEEEDEGEPEFVDNDTEEDPEDIFTDAQIDRLTDITCCVDDMINVMIQADPEIEGITRVELLEIADMVGQFLHDRYGFSVNLPLIMEDENGAFYVEEYPYADDEDEGGVLS